MRRLGSVLVLVVGLVLVVAACGSSTPSTSAAQKGSTPPSKWITACEVISSDQFQLLALNRSRQARVPPGWTVELLHFGALVGTSDQAGRGSVLGPDNDGVPRPPAAPGQTIHSSVWTLPGMEFSNCMVVPYDGGG